MSSQFFSRKLIAGLVLVALFASGCFKDKLQKTYTLMYPVYEEKSVVLANIKSNSPEEVREAGKIFLYGDYIFLNEINKGVHIIDNSNPSSPVNKAFISIPGNIDIAVKGNILYADFYTEMVAIDISNPLDAKLTALVSNVFPERQWVSGFVPDPNKVIIDWIEKDTTVEVDRDGGLFGGWWGRGFALASMDASFSSGGKSAVGVAGSMSRFAIVQNYLYAVNLSSLQTYSIANAGDPQFVRTNPMGWNIETIYPFKDKLFIGSATGMFIFDISNLSAPENRGAFNHTRACDPVVADDNYAFVTLRAGTFCEGTANQLDVINVSNVYSPTLVRTYAMTNPHGLAKDGNTLFICDGSDGLKVLDVSNVNDIKVKQHLKGMETFDVIAFNKKILLVTKSGLRQYDYSDLNNIRLLSTISVNK